MPVQCYIITSSSLVIPRFREICQKNNFPFDFEHIQLSDLAQIERTSSCLLCLDYRYIIEQKLNLEFLDGCKWILLTQEEFVHVDILEFPPLSTISLNESNVLIAERFKKIKSIIGSSKDINFRLNQLVFYDLSNKKVLVKPQEVLYIEADGDYSIIHCVKNESEELEHVTFSKNLKEMEIEFQNFGFYRIHRSFLANLNLATGIKGNSLLLKKDIVLPIARRRKKEVKHQMDAIMEKIH